MTSAVISRLGPSTGAHAAPSFGVTAIRIFAFVRLCLGLTPRQRGAHARSAAPLWPEMVLHYIVAAYTWSRDEIGDWSAVSLLPRTLVTGSTILGFAWWVVTR